MKKYAVDGLDVYPNELAHMLDDALELNAELLAALKALLEAYEDTDYPNVVIQVAAQQLIAKAEGSIEYGSDEWFKLQEMKDNIGESDNG